MWLAALVDARFGAELPAEIAMMLGIVAFVGEHGPDPRHDGEGGQEQPLEHQSVVDVGCGGRTGDGHAVAGDVVLGAPLAPVRACEFLPIGISNTLDVVPDGAAPPSM